MATLHGTFGIAARNFTAFPTIPDAQELVEYGVRMEELVLIPCGCGTTSCWVSIHISRFSIP